MKNGFAELGSVAEFINGAAFRPEDWSDSGKRIIRIQNLTDSAKPFNRTNRIVPEKLHVNPGDLLVSWSATLGVFEWHESDVALLNQHIFRVLPDESRVDKRYLRYGLELALVEMQQHLHGATMQHVNRREFLGTKLFMPPLAEQRRIAGILDKAEGLRAKRSAALAKIDILPQAIFFELFGDPTINGKNFPITSLASLSRKDDSINYGVVQPGDDVENGVPLIRVSDLVDGRVRKDGLKRISPAIEKSYKRSRLRGDEVLVSCVGSTGVVALADDSVKGFNIARAVARIPLSEATNRIFLAAYLGTSFVQRYFTNELRTVSQPTLNIKQISETRIMLPPVELQREFARRVEAVEKLKAAQRASLAKLDALFASLQNRAFRGEL